MSDRLEDIKEELAKDGSVWPLQRQDVEYLIALIDHLLDRVDALWKQEVNASDENEMLKQEMDRLRALAEDHYARAESLEAEKEMLRANQIPGRCGECGNKKIGKNITGQYEYCGLGNIYTETGFCHEWKPKE